MPHRFKILKGSDGFTFQKTSSSKESIKEATWFGKKIEAGGKTWNKASLINYLNKQEKIHGTLEKSTFRHKGSDDAKILEAFQLIFGDSEAQFNLGNSYLEKDPEKAVEFFRAATAQGNPAAECSLARCYIKGIGVEQNTEMAIKHYQSSADKGIADAQAFMGARYQKNLEVLNLKQDFVLALKYFKLAADQKNADGYTGLGLCYWNGEGVEKDTKEAVRLFTLGAEAGNAQAHEMLGLCYEHGIGGLAKSASKAQEHYQLAAKGGHYDRQTQDS